jgi:hypothetical protein
MEKKTSLVLTLRLSEGVFKVCLKKNISGLVELVNVCAN